MKLTADNQDDEKHPWIGGAWGVENDDEKNESLETTIEFVAPISDLFAKNLTTKKMKV
jgi:hypothetical protein